MRADGGFSRDGWSRVVAGGFHDVRRRLPRRPAPVHPREVPSLLTGSHWLGYVALVTLLTR